MLDGNTEHYRWLNRIWLALCYFTGGVLWAKFLNWGNIPFNFHDWAEINAPRLAFLRAAVIKGMLPLHMSNGSALRNLTDRFMALPDVFLSPQTVLLRILDVGPFVLVNTLLVYSLGVWGLWWFKKRFSLSPLVFTFLFLLFNFNGHILAHMSVGHFTWGGYFLSVWFVVLVVRLLDGDHSWRWIVGMASFLFITFLQGSFHQFVWECMFLIFLGLVAWKHWRPLLLTLLFAGLFCMVRFLPPTLLLGKFDTDFYGGYPSLWQLPISLILPATPQTSLPFLNFGSNLGYWEFDLYIGHVGALFVLIGILLWAWQQIKNRKFSPLWLPMLALVLFSISDIYLPFAKLPIPLLNGKRVTSRFAILPLTSAFFLAAAVIQNWLNKTRFRLEAALLGVVSLPYLATDLVRNTLAWQVTKAFSAFPTTPVNLIGKVVANHSDPPYITLLSIGAGITLISLLVALFLVWKENRQKRSL